MIPAARAALLLLATCCLLTACTASSSTPNPEPNHDRPEAPDETARRIHDIED